MRAAPRERQALLDRLWRLYVRLHGLDWRPFASDPARCLPEETVRARLDAALAFARRIGRPDFEPVLAWLRGRAVAIAPGRTALIHGDYHASNVLVRSDGELVVLDWTQAAVTDYRFDLGWTLLLVRAFEGATSRDWVLSEYERLGDGPVADAEYFETAAAARFLLPIVASLLDGPETVGMRPAAAAQMRASLRQVAAVRAFLRERTGLTIPSVEGLLAG